MLLIDSLTKNAFQQFVLDGIPGVSISCLLVYRPRMQQWYIDITYGTLIIQGIPVVNSPNFLRQWKNLIPFGIGCQTSTDLDPYLIDDFSNGVANLYLLNSTDVATVESTFFA